MIIAPSILAADFNNLNFEFKKINSSNADFIHLDVMDGKFVPNKTFDYTLIKTLRPLSKLVFDVHLMINNPDDVIDAYVDAGADYITFHYEAVMNHLEIINKIHRKNIKAGISIKPNTDISVLLPFLKDLDLILIMSVEPGYGGQLFIKSVLNKIKDLAFLKKENNYKYLIEVDGGINIETAPLVKENGGEALVVGTYLFKSSDFNQTLDDLKKV